VPQALWPQRGSQFQTVLQEDTSAGKTLESLGHKLLSNKEYKLGEKKWEKKPLSVLPCDMQ